MLYTTLRKPCCKVASFLFGCKALFYYYSTTITRITKKQQRAKPHRSRFTPHRRTAGPSNSAAGSATRGSKAAFSQTVAVLNF
jgi:hypothetical protein